MNKKVILLLLLAIGAAAVWAVPWLFSHGRTVQQNRAVEVATYPTLYCESCGYIFRMKPQSLPPLRCPKCGQPTAVRSSFGQCLVCKTYVPLVQSQWSAEDKAKWENRLKDGQLLSRDDQIEMEQAKLVKIYGRDWMSLDQLQRLPLTVKCPKCGNQDTAKIASPIHVPMEAAPVVEPGK